MVLNQDREHTHHGAMLFTALARATGQPSQSLSQSDCKAQLVDLFDTVMLASSEARPSRTDSCHPVAVHGGSGGAQLIPGAQSSAPAIPVGRPPAPTADLRTRDHSRPGLLFRLLGCGWCGGVPVVPDPTKADDSVKAANAVPFFDETHALDFRLAYANQKENKPLHEQPSKTLADGRPTALDRRRPWSIHGASSFAKYASAYSTLEQQPLKGLPPLCRVSA